MQQSDRAGLACVLAGFSALAVGDAVIKGMAGQWPVTAIGATRFSLAALALVTLLVARQGWSAVWRMPRAGLQWGRGLALTTASLSMFTALWLMPLAEATVITLTQPMITTMLAALLLGEQLRRGAVGATLVGFTGVVIVLRPNVAEIGWPALLPLLAAACMAVLMIVNRAASRVAGVWAMQAYIALTAAVFMGAATLLGHWSGVEGLRLFWPDWDVLARCAFVAMTATIGHWLIYLGTAKAGAATVAPMTYGQLVTAVLLGWVVFSERPDLPALIGAAVIVGSGLYLWRINAMKAPAETPP